MKNATLFGFVCIVCSCYLLGAESQSPSMSPSLSQGRFRPYRISCSLLEIVKCLFNRYPGYYCRYVFRECACRNGQWQKGPSNIVCSVSGMAVSNSRTAQVNNPFSNQRTRLAFAVPTSRRLPPLSSAVPVQTRKTSSATMGASSKTVPMIPNKPPMTGNPVKPPVMGNPAKPAATGPQASVQATNQAPGLPMQPPNLGGEGTMPPPTTNCPRHVMRVECRTDPCLEATCRNIQTAACRPNYCGGCLVEWYDNGMRAECNGKSSFPELIVKSSVVKDSSAYTNSENPGRKVAKFNPIFNQRSNGVVPRISHTQSRVLAAPMPRPAANSKLFNMQKNVMGMDSLFPSAGKAAASGVRSQRRQSSGEVRGTRGPIRLDSNAPLRKAPKSYIIGTQCTSERPAVTCPEDPCAGQTCARYPGARCRPVNCGNCYAKWFVGTQEVDCEVCSSVEMSVGCAMNPCETFSCPSNPTAICRWSKCEMCKNHWFVNGTEVSCRVPHPACPAGQAPRCGCVHPRCQSDLSSMCRVKGCGTTCQIEYYKKVDNQIVITECSQPGFEVNSFQ